MDKRSLDHFRKLLKSRRDEMHLRLAAVKASARTPSTEDVRDEADRATAATLTEMTAAQRAQTENMLKAINGALNQIDAGTFGECRNCGQEIGTKRLEAIPWARYCITCQELIDAT